MLGAMPAPVDHYAVLGVDPAATTDEIRGAYRRLVASEHADRHGGDAAAVDRTRDLNLARDVLVDPVQRAAFDASRAARPPVPLFDALADIFGAAPPANFTGRMPPPPPTWLQAVAVGFFGAATIVTIAAAAIRAARERRL